MTPWTASDLRRAARSPLVWIVTVTTVLHLVGLGWGLPGTEGWDDDGIAPRDFLFGTLFTYWPGHYFTYPPAQLLLLTLLTLPITIVGLARAHSFAPDDLLAEFVRAPYMTSFAVIARLVTVAMSIGIVLALAALARRIRGEPAARWVAAVAGANTVFTYYAHTTNLDVPYLFWTSLALLWFARAVTEREPRRLRGALLFMALAVGTKDQAYASFLLGLPAGVALWFFATPFARRHPRAVARELLVSIALAAFVLLALDGALFNPSGFAARLRFLSGPASQDHAIYALGWAGAWRVLCDAVAYFPRYYPLAFAPLVVLGIVLTAAHAVRAARARRDDDAENSVAVAALLPLLFSLSFTIAFNLVARRTEHRFLLPQMLLLAVYGGFGLDALYRATSAFGPWRTLPIATLFAPALYASVAVDAALLFDPRYDAEQWLSERVAPGDVVETYGNNVYLPRFKVRGTVVRIGPEDAAHRSLVPRMVEVQDTYDGATRRRPRWIVVSQAWVWRYLYDDDSSKASGRIVSADEAHWESDRAACRFFGDLHRGKAGYRLAHLSAWQSSLLPRVDIHASTTREIRIFEREDP